MPSRSETANVLFINVTTQCNIDCQRCYLTQESRRDGRILPLHLLEKLFSYHKFQHEESRVAWEGGELTIIGEDRMREFIALKDRLLPHARQSVITNLFNLPHWLIELLLERRDISCETTFALGKKANLAGDEQVYLDRFRNNLNQLGEAGIICPVNIELNKETVEQGADKLVEFILSTNQKHWEFDVSCDFPVFMKNPRYIKHYPLLYPTISYAQSSRFMIDLYLKHWSTLVQEGIVIEPLRSIVMGSAAIAFNVGRDHAFFTVNPDGTISSDALFSDLKGTIIGNLNTDSVGKILSNEQRSLRQQYEKERIKPCLECPHFDNCLGGPSHVPLFDSSGECSGNKRLRDIFYRSHGYS